MFSRFICLVLTLFTSFPSSLFLYLVSPWHLLIASSEMFLGNYSRSKEILCLNADKISEKLGMT